MDPCQLVTQSEASSLAGARFGKGKSGGNGTSGRRCVYGAQTLNVFTVEVAKAKSIATARADWDEAQAQAEAAVKQQAPPGVNVSLKTSDVAIGDRAATIYGTATLFGKTFGFSGIYVLKGTTFFAFQDLLFAHKPPSTAHLESEARTVLGRVS